MTGALAHPLSSGELFLEWGEGRGESVGWVEGWLGWSSHPLGDTACRDHV